MTDEKTKANLVRSKLIEDIKKVFKKDQRRIEHALAVLNYAEHIQAAEGGNLLVVRAGAILHDIGIHEAERKYGSSSGKYQELEGPPIARKILVPYDLGKDVVEHICRIIANHHSAKHIDTAEFRIVWDADWMVNIPVEFPDAGREKLQEIIDKVFKTRRGHQIAVESLTTETATIEK